MPGRRMARFIPRRRFLAGAAGAAAASERGDSADDAIGAPLCRIEAGRTDGQVDGLDDFLAARIEGEQYGPGGEGCRGGKKIGCAGADQ